MSNIDTQLAHERARDTHNVRQQIAGLRFAAGALSIANKPSSRIQAEVVNKVISTLLSDASMLETQL